MPAPIARESGSSENTKEWRHDGFGNGYRNGGDGSGHNDATGDGTPAYRSQPARTYIHTGLSDAELAAARHIEALRAMAFGDSTLYYSVQIDESDVVADKPKPELDFSVWPYTQL